MMTKAFIHRIGLLEQALEIFPAQPLSNTQGDVKARRLNMALAFGFAIGEYQTRWESRGAGSIFEEKGRFYLQLNSGTPIRLKTGYCVNVCDVVELI